MPRFESWVEEPIPDRSRSLGVSMVPAVMITSLFDKAADV